VIEVLPLPIPGKSDFVMIVDRVWEDRLILGHRYQFRIDPLSAYD